MSDNQTERAKKSTRPQLEETVLYFVVCTFILLSIVHTIKYNEVQL